MRTRFNPFVLAGIGISLFPTAVFANSSWHWISETRPFDVLPWVIVLTLVIEVSVMFWCTKVHFAKVAGIVAIANLISFIAPYGLNWILDFTSVGYSFEQYLNHWPAYIIGIYYGLLTLIVEVPVVYNKFKHEVSKKKLALTIVMVNIVTTIMVFAIERIVCEGAWA